MFSCYTTKRGWLTKAITRRLLNMCGRFARKDSEEEFQQRFDFDNPDGVLFEPKYNIAPSQICPIVVVEDDRRVIKPMRWGLIPVWAKDTKIGYNMINARAETIAEKNSFKTPLKKTRCLVPTSGFYEWKKLDKKTKIPYYFHMKNNEPFAFAGLWTTWHRGQEDQVISFTIITTSANELMEPIHDRMPVILQEKDEAKWLDPELKEPEELLPLLAPYPSELMNNYEVSTFVNSYRNEGEECIQPIS